MRKEIIAGNWKMFKTKKETKEYFSELLDAININEKEVVIFTPYTSLDTAVEATKASYVKIGAQNVHYESNGAYTGEVSVEMIEETNAAYVLIGHSERRKYYAESNESVNLKIKKVLTTDLIPMMCVGEDLAEREANRTFDVLRKQLTEGLADINSDRLIVAYEPVWAIGTGKTATDMQAEEACRFIRECLKDICADTSDNIRILYGGSVKPDNIKGIMAQSNIDGVLVGGASLKSDFVKLVNYDK